MNRNLYQAIEKGGSDHIEFMVALHFVHHSKNRVYLPGTLYAAAIAAKLAYDAYDFGYRIARHRENHAVNAALRLMEKRQIYAHFRDFSGVEEVMLKAIMWREWRDAW